ncbi:MAG TPA: FAD-dependent oxidoreductase, partial [Cryptosporangiaceae bacterium]|nr:FAD-dependent oxidoreductase [Cryptosporangiaceae bacterium]
PGVTVLRASVGRHGDERVPQVSDAELVAAVRGELAALLAVPGGLPAPVATSVTRWGGALPQYAVGHLDRVARARSALSPHPTLVLAGAAYDGVGVPACIRSGQTAAEEVLAALPAGWSTAPTDGAAPR